MSLVGAITATESHSYVHEFFLNTMALVLVESMPTGQEICFICVVLTSFPTTFPRDRILNTNVIGTGPLVEGRDKVDAAPYMGTLIPSKLTDTVR